jgi:hypothetical protein
MKSGRIMKVRVDKWRGTLMTETLVKIKPTEPIHLVFERISPPDLLRVL